MEMNQINLDNMTADQLMAIHAAAQKKIEEQKAANRANDLQKLRQIVDIYQFSVPEILDTLGLPIKAVRKYLKGASADTTPRMAVCTVKLKSGDFTFNLGQKYGRAPAYAEFKTKKFAEIQKLITPEAMEFFKNNPKAAAKFQALFAK